MGNLDRNWVAVVGDRDWPAALHTAQEIAEPVSRVAALVGLAGNAPEDRVDEVLRLAMDAAAGGGDGYQRCRGLAAVIGGALGRGRTEHAWRLLAEVLAGSAEIEPLSSRAAALEQLLRHAVVMGEGDARAVASAMLDVAEALKREPIGKWRKRGAYVVNQVVRGLGGRHESLALELLTARFGKEKAAAIWSRHGELAKSLSQRNAKQF